MGGIFSLWGAVVAGVLSQLLPALLNSWGLPPDLLTIIFGIGVLQVLVTAPRGLAYQFPRDMQKLGLLLFHLARSRSPAAESRVIEVEDLTVRFGGVTPIDGMTVSFAEGTCGLIGPNGAGKTTFFNVLSGFVKPRRRQRPRLRRGSAAHGRLPACAVGTAPHLPDRSRRSRSCRSSTTSP